MLSKFLQKGFSLVETMVAMGLLSGAIVLGMNFVGDQTKSRETRSKQSIHRFIAIQVTQHINANLPFYPPIAPMNPSDKIVYVGCLTKEGTLIANKFKFHIATAFDETVSLGICPTISTVYEVRFFWVDPVTDTVKINLLTLNTNGNQSLAVHNFKIFAK